MQETKARSYSLSERIRIVHEYETSGLTLKEVANKYGILGHSTIAKWRYSLQNSRNYCNFAVGKKSKTLMNDPERQALEHQISNADYGTPTRRRTTTSLEKLL